MKKSHVPIVAIVGRANVGKSSLFNALLGRREAIVANEPGTTRDSITAKAELESGKQFWLVDTAGLKDAADAFELTIQDQIVEAANSADVILVTVDATTIITDEDRRVAKLAFKSGKKLILLVNKCDKAKKNQIAQFEKLGIKPLIATSATQKRGFDELEEALDELLPVATIQEADDRIRIALLGRPNVGKSSLYNALAKKQQAIVADRAGTTRDVNHTLVKYMGRELEILDTAGIRRSGRIEKGVEQFSVLRSLQAIEQADICFLLIDANELSVALDQKIAGLIKEAGKGLVIVVSKWDIKEKDAFTRDDVAPGIAYDFNFVPWAPLIFTSSETGKNVTKLFDLALEIMARRAQSITTRELNNWLKRVTDRVPPAGLKNRLPKLRYMVQEEGNPIPAFKIFGSQTRFLHWSYRRHMERMLREQWDYIGTPVQLWFIDRDPPPERKFKNNGNRDKYVDSPE
ncbi:MAG TPA: ribosome biogenesis GTPase Der [Candidatus Saccharibacteria bacterium]|jgi:GTP-binding protein|nr:ribosome biogenesis GTPase Der [Candidatus Saccharibacteria bacterium]